MKLYGGGSEDWGGWKPTENYPWYQLKFEDTETVKSIIFENLEKNKNFSYIRIGDGPIGYIDDMTHRWHPKDEKIRQEFIRIFNVMDSFDENDFMAGLPFDTPLMSGGIISSIKVQQQCWKVVQEFFPRGRRYYAHNLPHWLLCCDMKSFDYFLNLLKGKRVCIVGNEKFPQNVLEFLFGKDVKHIKVPYLNAFYSHERLTNEVLNMSNEIDVFLFAASFATYPIIINTYEKIGNTKTMIDIGSIIDPFVNYFTDPSLKTAVTTSGKRGWWLIDYPNVANDFVNMRKNQ